MLSRALVLRLFDPTNLQQSGVDIDAVAPQSEAQINFSIMCFVGEESCSVIHGES